MVVVTTKIVGVADCGFSSNPNEMLLTYALGSCIGVAAYDPIVQIGGLLHFLLPDCGLETPRGRDNRFLYADSGTQHLINGLVQLGASKNRLVIRIAGGANVVDDGGFFGIGKRNHVGVRKALWKAGLLIRSEAVGGSASRSLKLEMSTGRVWVKEDGKAAVELGPNTTK